MPLAPTAKRLRRSSYSHYSYADRERAVASLDQLGIDIQTFAAGIFTLHHRIRGEHNPADHEFLGKVYEAVNDHADTIAELVEQLGGESSGSVEELADGTRLEPIPRGIVDCCEVMALVANRAAFVLAYAEETIGVLEDLGFRSISNEVMNVQVGIAKWGWKVEASLPLAEDIAETVHEQLSADFDAEHIGWVRDVEWSGPQTVGLATQGADPSRAKRFVTDGSEIVRGDDGVLRV
jgi:DNA-binding ferritin-like protein